MRLTTQTDYALRMLIFLEVMSDVGSHRIDDVAKHYGISKNHLMKVAQKLSAAGFIESKRGRGGGLSLSKPAAQINIGDVVRQMEEVDQFVECHTASNNCLITPVCGLKGIFEGATAAFLAHLDHFTLADTISNPKKFLTLFEREAA